MLKQLAFLHTVYVEITQRHMHTLLILTRLHYQQPRLSPSLSTAAGRGFLEGGDYVGGYSPVCPGTTQRWLLGTSVPQHSQSVNFSCAILLILFFFPFRLELCNMEISHSCCEIALPQGEQDRVWVLSPP